MKEALLWRCFLQKIEKFALAESLRALALDAHSASSAALQIDQVKNADTADGVADK